MRPVSQDGYEMPESLWAAVKACWQENPGDGPAMLQLVQMLHPSAVTSNDIVMLHWLNLGMNGRGGSNFECPMCPASRVSLYGVHCVYVLTTAVHFRRLIHPM